MFESKSGVLLIGGLGFFAFAFLSNALVPALMYRHLPEATVTELVESEQQHHVSVRGSQSSLSRQQFAKYFGKPTMENMRRGFGVGTADLRERRLPALP